MLRGPVFSEFSASSFNQNISESKIDFIDFEAASSLQNTSELLLEKQVDVISSSLVRMRRTPKMFPLQLTDDALH